MRTTGILLALAAAASPLAAQVVVTGKIVDDSTRAPIEGAEIVVEGPGSRRAAVSNAEGLFTLDGMTLGVGAAIVRKIGYRPLRLRTLAFSDDTVEVEIRLPKAVVELAPLEVKATSLPSGMTDYANRRFTGMGNYIDPEELRRSEGRRLSDLLRGMRGVQIRPTSGNRYIAVSGRSGCASAVWLDNMQIYNPERRNPVVDIDQIPISQLEAVEIYRGAADTPIELGPVTSCGTIVLWTRRR